MDGDRTTPGVCALKSGVAVGSERLAALGAWREIVPVGPVRGRPVTVSIMKCTIPEISWHNRDPVLSIDVQPSKKAAGDGPCRLASGGTDSHVLIWYIHIKESGQAEVEFASDLQRHQRAVNVVRFSPSGELLASGDDESVIIVWKLKSEQDAPELPTNELEANRENWITVKVLRGHLEDVYDLSWSPDSLSLISGSVDNSAVLWDVHKGRALHILKEHTGFVQGVTWDPKNQYVATMSSDRTCRIYSLSSKRVVHHVSKAQLPAAEGSGLDGKVVRLFHDDTLKSFFRRLCFTPDGELLVVPSGLVEVPDSGQQFNATFIFTRNVMKRPVLYLPSPDQYTVAVRCCPRRFRLHPAAAGTTPVFSLPYRLVLAVATQSSVVLYDTQQPEPFGLVSNIHYTRLTDLSWSCDGQVLVVSSTDGYCSIITFADGELGDVYEETSLLPDVTEQKSQDVAVQNPQEVTVQKSQHVGEQKPQDVAQQNPQDVAEHKPLDKAEQKMQDESKERLQDVAEEMSDNVTEQKQQEVTPQKGGYSSPVQEHCCLQQQQSSSTGKTPRRVKLITLSSPKSRKRLPQ